MVGILITGPLADRFGAKAFALLGNALLDWIGSDRMVTTYGVLLAATFGLGLGAGILDMVLSPVVAAINPNADAAMNWLHSFYCGRCCYSRGWHACIAGRRPARRQPASNLRCRLPLFACSAR